MIFASNVKGYEDLSTSVRGAEVAKIVAAIAVAKKESRLVEASPAFRLEFFKGAQRLGTADAVEHPPLGGGGERDQDRRPRLRVQLREAVAGVSS